MSAKIAITGSATHLVLGGDVPPYHTGKKTTPNHTKVRLRNFTNRKLRICFKSQDTRNINQIFTASVTPDGVNPKIGSVAISRAPTTGSPFREKTVELLEAAFLAADSQLSVSANLFTTGICDFPPRNLDHVQDIIIDGGF